MDENCFKMIVEVIWQDAHVTLDTLSVKQATKLKPILTHTIGYLMAYTDEGLSLATDTYPKQPKEGKIVNFIGWGMIVDWFALEIQDE
jgi:hypothetical protein